MKSMEWPATTVEPSGAKFGVWELWGATYEGPDWYTPLYKLVGEFATKAEALAYEGTIK
jgi:hypothetical protein